jgi:hypothetical protein
VLITILKLRRVRRAGCKEGFIEKDSAYRFGRIN